MFIAGRIEFLGKHTDYCGGRSIVCAIDRGFSVVAMPSAHGSLVVTDENAGETLTIPFAENAADNTRGWAIYPATVVSRVARNFAGELKSGVTVSFRGDLPRAAGLSSSSALITAMFCAVAKNSGIAESAKYARNILTSADLAEFLGCIENGSGFKELEGAAGVGTFGGSQDHAAIICSENGRLTLFSFSPLTSEAAFDFPKDLSFVVAASGVAAEKTGDAMAKYNRLSGIVRAVVAAWPEKEKSLATLIREHGIDAVVKFAGGKDLGFEPNLVENRLRHFDAESFEIIPAVSQLLASGRINEIGELVDRSQQNSERLLGNQIPETVFLQRTARGIGAMAASAFGAGFGGSVYAVVKTSDAVRFMAEWHGEYLKRFPEYETTAEFFISGPSASKLV